MDKEFIDAFLDLCDIAHEIDQKHKDAGVELKSAQHLKKEFNELLEELLDRLINSSDK